MGPVNREHLKIYDNGKKTKKNQNFGSGKGGVGSLNLKRFTAKTSTFLYRKKYIF
jgi:hypothetical protein